MKPKLSILSVNINGISSKIEDLHCIDIFRQYDIVCLSELKTTYSFTVPGFRSVRSSIIPGEELRGGVAVLFSCSIWQYVFDVQREHDQVWFKLRNTPDFVYGAVYIAPRDSPFFSLNSFALIQTRCLANNCKTVVLGDINARMSNLDLFRDEPDGIDYTINPDTNSNANGGHMIDVCRTCCLTPVNHLVCGGRAFPGNLTFRQRSTWVSQLDWAFVSKSALPHIQSFNVHQSLSLPTNHAPISIEINNFRVPESELLIRAKWLGETHVPHVSICRNPIPIHRINTDTFISNLPSTEDLWSLGDDVNTLCYRLTECLYDVSIKAKTEYRPQPHPRHLNAGDRWSYLIRNGDYRKIWQAIGWNGCFDSVCDSRDGPSDAEFVEHYNDLLNPPSDTNRNYTPNTHKYMPILDDPISPGEVDDARKSMNSNKAAGVDGVAPGILKLLTDEWIVIITFLFNLVFSAIYPAQWTLTKVFNIFKKGNRFDPNNYRGISILVALGKLYDLVLCKRFMLWYNPKYEQAGAQKNRGCEEQILTLRLLIDIARKSKRTLYITFIDYVKAYDKVNRYKLLQILDSKGCGSKFLKALASSLHNSSGVIGSETFQATAGVRQGASMSCPLFTLYIEATVDAIASGGPDGWLGELHGLLLMDDTAVVATSRRRMEQKLASLKACVDDLDGKMHPEKSRFIVVNDTDVRDFVLDDVRICHIDSYTYLGTPISNNPIGKQVRQHVASKASHVIKFTAFLHKNDEAPYNIKRQVWMSALQTAIFYSCETWLTVDLRAAESVYMSTLKQLLGVRLSTCNDIAMVEAGVGDAKSYIKERQSKFLHKLLARNNFADSYVGRVVDMAINVGCPAGSLLSKLKNLGPEHNFRVESLSAAGLAIRGSVSTRRTTYLSINPDLSASPLSSVIYGIPEYYRIACTRIRTSSHRLRVETGRWARIPMESRLCRCGEIQTEEHVLLRCPLTEDIRSSYAISQECNNITELLNVDHANLFDVCHLCARVLNFFS